jgi:hypothetical protein
MKMKWELEIDQLTEPNVMLFWNVDLNLSWNVTDTLLLTIHLSVGENGEQATQ